MFTKRKTKFTQNKAACILETANAGTSLKTHKRAVEKKLGNQFLN